MNPQFQENGYYSLLNGDMGVGLLDGVNMLKGIMSGGGDGDSIAKATQVIGTPPDRTANDFAKYVPEEISMLLRSETSSDRNIVVSKSIPYEDVFSTEYKFPVVKSWGAPQELIPGSFSESSDGPAESVQDTVLRSVLLRLYGVKRSQSQLVASVGMVGGLNVNGTGFSRDGVQKAIAFSIRDLAYRNETQLLWGNDTVEPLEVKGIIQQINTSGIPNKNVFDMAGTPLTWFKLLTAISGVSGAPRFARIEKLWLDETTWAYLGNTAADGGRWLQAGGAITARGGNGWTYNPETMRLMGPTGISIEVEVVPALVPHPEVNAVQVGTSPTLTRVADLTSATAGGSGTTMPAQTVKWIIQGVFTKGSPVPFATLNVTLTAGQQGTIVMDDATFITDTTNPLRHYDLWRTDDGGDVTTAKFVKSYPVGNVSGHTEMIDDNSSIPGASTCLGVQLSESSIFNAALLKPIRIPIPGFQIAFVLAQCTAPAVASPTKQLLFKNIVSPAVVA